jgi:hypothetical protein
MLAALLCICWAALPLPCAAQQPRTPNVEAQRAAMKKLDFLLGKWSGEARVIRPGEPLDLIQTEDVQYKLDDLLLQVEGTGTKKADGAVAFRALAIISYDDAASQYRIRAFTEGRFVDAELTLAADGRGFTWGITNPQFKTSYVMTLNDKGEWTEVGDVTVGTQPPRRFVEMTVRRSK